MNERAKRIQTKAIKQLKKLRIQQGLSHDVLAKRAGVTRSAVGHIENGKRNPSLLMCLRLAYGLNIELSDLLEKIEKECPKSRDCPRCKQRDGCLSDE